MRPFFDTNVLLYAEDLRNPEKARVAREVLVPRLAERSAVFSTQVLQEYYYNAQKKLGIGAALAKERVVVYAGMPLVTITTDLVLSAIDLHRLDALSFWDALIVTAADHAGCDVLYTDDLQHGKRFGSVRVVNPFA